MKITLVHIYILFLFGCTDNTSSKISQSAPHILKKNFYPSGPIKEIISYNDKGLKDSISKYYDEDGYLDSFANYSNGKLNGIKFFYGNGGTYKNLYKDDSLIQQNWYDSAGILKYSLPVNIANVSKTRVKFSSGRDYFDRTKTDTIEFFNKGLPSFNRIVNVSKGISLRHLNDSAYIIKLSNNSKTLKEIKIVTAIAQDLENPVSKHILFDSIYINVK